MGRSVWTHGDAVETVFKQLDFDEDDLSWGAWHDFLDDIREQFKQRFPSMRDCDHWPERESHAIVENSHCMVVISEYCGLVSIGVVPKGDADYYNDTTGLAGFWTEHYAMPFLQKHFGELRKVGTFSNGEAVFERIA